MALNRAPLFTTIRPNMDGWSRPECNGAAELWNRHILHVFDF